MTVSDFLTTIQEGIQHSELSNLLLSIGAYVLVFIGIGLLFYLILEILDLF